MERKLLLIVVLVLGTLVSCMSVQERAAMLKTEHPKWSDSVIQQVAARQIEPGMTEEMVIAALGRKGEVNAGREFGEMVWVYYKGVTRGQGAWWEPIFWVYFKNGKVVRAEGDQWRLPVW